jgi:hypothetical protein
MKRIISESPTTLLFAVIQGILSALLAVASTISINSWYGGRCGLLSDFITH